MTPSSLSVAPARLAARPSSLLLRTPFPASDFDQHQRYALAARLLDRLLRDGPTPVRILDVGANRLDLFSRYLDPTLVQVARCDFLDPDPADSNYVQLRRGEPLPFDDDSFDAVAALDVLEHVPAAERGEFLADCLRVARRGGVFTCPDGGPAVEAAEALAGAAYLARHGRPHPFLSEHREFGLPTADEVRDLFHQLGAPYAAFGNAPLATWISRMMLDEHLAEGHSRRRSSLTRCDPRPLPGGPYPYRMAYVAVKAFDAADALAPLPIDQYAPAPAVVPAGPDGDPATVLNQLTADFARVLVDVQDHLAREHTAALAALRKEGEKAVGEWRSHAARRYVADSFVQSTQGSTLRRLVTPLQRLKNWVRPIRFDAAALVPFEQLTTGDGPGEWRAVAHDPCFLAPCLLPAGWVRLRLKLTRHGEEIPRREHAEVFADYGDGCRADTCLQRFTWFGSLDEEVYLFLPKAAQALRFDPLDGPGQFRIERFEAQSVTGPRGWVAALTNKLDLLFRYQCAGRVLSRGAGDLLHGRFSRVRRKLFQGLHDARTLRPAGPVGTDEYAEWRRRRAITDADRAQLRTEAAVMTDPPVIAVLMPVCDPPVECLRKAIDSVRRQTYPHWQLCIADDASTAKPVRDLLMEVAAADPRIRVTFREVRGGISTASNDALALVEGRYIALLDHDDEIAEHALSLFAREMAAHPRADFLYSDEDKIELDGRHVDPFLKPDWSPEFFESCMFTCHLGVYRTELVRRLGGFRMEYDFAQDYDLALRVVAAIDRDGPAATGGQFIRAPHADRIRHVRDVLYHWRKLPTSSATGNEAKPTAELAARRALESYLVTSGKPGTVEPGPRPGYHRVRHTLQSRPKISLVIPTAGKPAVIRGRPSSYIGNCLESVRRLSTYDRYEFVVIDNGDLTPELAAQIDRLGARRVRYESSGSFNLAEKINFGAAHATGEMLVLLNDDIEVISPDWLECMLEYAQLPGVGAVGAKLLFPDDTLQHVGVTLLEGRPGHPFYGFPGEYPGYYCGSVVPRNYSAVTGACVMVRADLYRQLGGFDPAFPLNYNDVDFCLKVLAAGHRIVWTPYAELYHFESVSKSEPPAGELDAFLQRWGSAIPEDPFYHPLLIMHYHDYRLGEVAERPSQDRWLQEGTNINGN